MLTFDAILKATRQMASYGDRGTAGSADPLPSRVQGPREKMKAGGSKKQNSAGKGTPARRWDAELKIHVRD